jgi:hypothetical protein
VPYSAATFMILPHLWLLLEGQRPLLTACRLAYLLEKAHVQAPRRLGNRYPVHPLTYVLCPCRVGLYGDERVSGEGSSPLAAGAIGRISRPRSVAGGNPLGPWIGPSGEADRLSGFARAVLHRQAVGVAEPVLVDEDVVP